MYSILIIGIHLDTHMKTLTEKQQTILTFLSDYTQQRGFPPTMREIGVEIGVPSVSAVRGHLAALEKKGYISKDSDKARSICVLHAPSPISRLKRKLHSLAHTDKGVLHHMVYGIVLATKGRGSFFTGVIEKAMVRELEKRAIEHGWKILSKVIGPDHIALTLEVWPNHSAELVARRIKAAGESVLRKHPKKWKGKSLWARGFAATTETSHVDELARMFLDSIA